MKALNLFAGAVLIAALGGCDGSPGRVDAEPRTLTAGAPIVVDAVEADTGELMDLEVRNVQAAVITLE